MNRFAIIALTVLVSSPAFAGGNVAFNVRVNTTKISNKASNHPDYQAIEFSGRVVLSDAKVSGLTGGLPESVSLLFKASSETDKYLATFCEKYASIAQASGKYLRVDIFMPNPAELAKLIEGGMTNNRFNTFLLKADDPRIDRISCSVE